MSSFENSGSSETYEVLTARASALAAEIARLTQLSAKTGENIDVELGSDAYVDHGYIAEARELQNQLDQVNETLRELDDQSAAQRNLSL